MQIPTNIGIVKREATSLLAALTLRALTLGAVSSIGLAQGESPGQRAEIAAPVNRSWIFAITRTQTPVESFAAVASFAAGGVFTATGFNDRVKPVSALHGSWQRIGRQRFSSTTYFFAFDPAKPNGGAIAMLKPIRCFS